MDDRRAHLVLQLRTTAYGEPEGVWIRPAMGPHTRYGGGWHGVVTRQKKAGGRARRPVSDSQ